MADDPVDPSSVVADPDRLRAVLDTGLMDTGPEEVFDRLTRAAAELTGAPVAFIALVDADRDFYKSHSGFAEPLAAARQVTGRTFCHYAIARGETLAIDDTRAHTVYSRVPTVETMGVAAYLGVPLMDQQGHALGSLCVIDFKPRGWRLEDRARLAGLADLAMREIETRRNK